MMTIEEIIEALRNQANAARLGEKRALETIADRDAEIAQIKAELDETRADLAGLQCALIVTPEQRGGYVTTAAPPTGDPRIAALCRVVSQFARTVWINDELEIGEDLLDDLETIEGER